MTGIDVNEADEKIVRELLKGRNRPSNLARQLDYTREYVSQRLKRLREHGVVNRPDSGIYEITDRAAVDLTEQSGYREKAIEAHGEECAICGADENIQIHHIDGDRSNDNLDNLVPVCRPHHYEIHSQNGELQEWTEKILPRDERGYDRIRYQFEIDADTWNEWKATVPREKSLHARIRELLNADRAGVVPENPPVDDAEGPDAAREPRGKPAEEPDETPRDGAPASSSSADVDVLDAMDIPQGKDPEACRDALYAVRDYLEEHGPASRREIVTAVMPDHPLGYDVPDLETGDRFRGAWWRRIIQPGLRALDDVEYRENHSDYRVP